MITKKLSPINALRIVVGITFILLSVACNNPSGNTKYPMVSSNFYMIGSAQTATVAKLNEPAWKTFFSLPSALALTPPAMIDKTGLNVSLTQAWIVIKQIEFMPGQSRRTTEVDGVNSYSNGPFYIDLMAALPAKLDTIRIPSMPYHRIKMRLEKSGASIPAWAPTQLATHSIYLTGTVAGVGFTYFGDDASVIEMSGTGTAKPRDSGDLIVSIQLANLFKQINFSSITMATTISSTNKVAGANLCPAINPLATDLYTCIKNGIATHGNMGVRFNKFHDLDLTDEHIR